MSFELLITKGFLFIFLSLETLAHETKILIFKLKTRKFLKRIHTTFSITLTSHKETKHEEQYFMQVLEIYVLCNITNIHDNSFVVQFGSVGH